MTRRSIQSATGRNIALLLCIILFQAGCTTTPLIPTPDLGPGTAMDWALQGKMALRSDQGSANLKINWQQQGDRFDIHLIGPLGQAVAHVYGNSDALQVDTADQSKQLKTGEFEALRGSLGWEIPVKEMSFWVRGHPVPELVHEIAYDQQGLPEWLLQSGWRVEYQKFRQQQPVRTIFTRDSVRILLVVKEWRLNETR